MKRLEERLRETKRLTILQLIAALEPKRIDLMTLGYALRDFGQETERTVLEGEVRWMGRQGLVVIDEPMAGVLQVSLTQRGDMAQRGEVEEPGVARPALP